jgi:60 kDa SS-A/Ro ribonucleoprotein
VTAEKLARIHGGGTAVGAPIEYLLDRKIKVDVFIGITDNEDWDHGDDDGHSVRGSFLSLWRDYRRAVNPNAKAFLVTIAPYRDAVAPKGEKGVRFIYGWSDRVLEYMTLSLDEGKTQVQAIDALSLESR